MMRQSARKDREGVESNQEYARIIFDPSGMIRKID
jgi:hypothetical protein